MKTHTKRRAITALSVAAAAGVVLAGCAGPAAEDSGDVTLTVQAWADTTQAEVYEEVFDVFEEKNPGVTVKLDWMDVGSYQDKLATKFAAGSPPDVMFLVGLWLAEYASRGALADLSEFSDEIDFDDLPESILASGQLDGATYGMPTGSTAIGFVYNNEIVEQAGLEMPDDSTWTWEDFETFNKEIFDATGVYGTGFYVPWTPAISTFARQRGEDFYTEDGELGVSVDTVEDYFQMTVDMRANGGFAPAGSLEDQGSSTAESPLGKDFIASQVIPSNVFPDFQSALDGKLALMRFPGETEGERPGMAVTPTLLWAAAAQSKHPEEAAKLIDFLTNDPESYEARSTLLGVPINPAVAEEVAAGLEPDAKTFVDYVLGLQEEDLAPYFLEPAGAGEVGNALVSVGTEVEFGRMTPREAAEKFVSEAESILANAG
ncbi:ABC transporter substrate-binding protein [Micromonospora sp. DT81.3]|uniref:ABC transporter substrate-binding protein n=1 Tax=Micromonospora sp. DT81.3 TaxID=3416523 RepID=UPI003CF10B70